MNAHNRNRRGRGRPLFVFLGHHKAGTRWIGLVLDGLARSAGLKWECTSHPEWFGWDLQRFVDERDIDVLSYTNAEPRYLAQLDSFRGLHVIRDPRDIAVSAYFSHRYSHGTEYWPELETHRRRLAGLSHDEGLLLDIDFTTSLPTAGYNLRPFHALASWDFGHPDTLEMRFEDLTSAPVDAFCSALEFAGVSIPRATVARIVEDNRFEVLSGGRSPGHVDATSHYRCGVPGDWRRHLKQVHLDALTERIGDLAVKLGYPPN